MVPSAPNLTCKVKIPTSGASYVRCRAYDPDGLRRITVKNAATGVIEQSIAFGPHPRTKLVSFRLPLGGDAHRVSITDLVGKGAKYFVSNGGTVTRL